MTDVRRIQLPPTYMRKDEVSVWPLAVGFPTKVLGFEDLSPGVECTQIKIGPKVFAGDTLAESASYRALPGGDPIEFTFSNLSGDDVQRHGFVLLDQQALPGAPAVNPKPIPGATRPPDERVTIPRVELEETVGFEHDASTRSNHYMCRLTHGQMRVIQLLLKGKSVHPAERESVRNAFERELPK